MKFLRRTHSRYSKIGKRRKKKLKWRKPTGRDNKMRDRRRGYPASVAIGYSGGKKEKGKIENKTPVIIRNASQTEKMKKNQIAILGKMGKRKKIEIAKKAKEMKIEIYKMNIEKFLKLNEKRKEQKPAEEKKTENKGIKK